MAVNKRIMLIGGILLATVFGGLVVLFVYIGRVDTTTRLEQWIGRQIVAVLESHITPHVGFRTLDYQAPRTVVVQDLTLTAEGVPILAISRMLLELAEIPREGRPIQIRRIELEQPNIQFISLEEGGFVGWHDFVRPEVRRDPDLVPEGRRFSDVLVLRHAEIRGGQVTYAEPGPDGERMVLPGIDMDLRTPPVPDEPGAYALAGTLTRDPIFRMEIDGQINLDTALFQLAQLQLTATIGEEQYETLPPSVQRVLRRREVQGDLTASVQGTIPLGEPENLELQVQADLRDARFAHEGHLLVGHLNVNARWPEGPIEVSAGEIGLQTRGRSIVSVGRIALTVAGAPPAGEPVRIERLECDEPRLAFIRGAAGELLGWSELANYGNGINERVDSETLAGQFVLEQLAVRSAAVVYAPDPQAEPLGLEGIDITLQVRPLPDQPEVYTVAGTVVQEPLLSGEVAGRLDVASAVLDVERLSLNASFNGIDQAALPPAAAELIRRHQIHGELALTGSGRIPLREPAAAAARVDVNIQEASFAYEDLRVPIGSARLEVALPEGSLSARVGDLFVHARDPWPAATDQNRDLQETQPGESTTEIRELLIASIPDVTIEVPRALDLAPDEALIIGEVRLDRPRLGFFRDPDGALVGWSVLQSEDAAPPGGGVELRRLEAVGAEVAYETAEGMASVSDLDVVLTAAPSEEPGWLDLAAELRRADLFGADFAGRFDSEHNLLQIDRLQVEAVLDEAQFAALPPPLQRGLREHDVQGTLRATVQGLIPLEEPARSSGRIELEVTDGRFTRAGTVWPMARLQAEAVLPDGPVQLVATDLHARHEDQAMLAILRADVELLRLPGSDETIEVSSLRLQGPRINLLGDRAGGFVGWSRLLEPSPTEPDAGRQGERPLPNPAGSPVETQPLLVHELEVQDGELNYDPADGSPPMALGGIQLRASRLPDTPGGYTVSGSVVQEPILSITGRGRLDDETWRLSLDELRGNIELGEEAYRSAPPDLQRILREHLMQGRLTASLEGTIPLREPAQTSGRVQLELAAGSVSHAGITWPAARLEVTGTLPGGPFSIAGVDLEALHEGRPLLAVRQLDLDLARLPQDGQPAEIRRLVLQGPRLHLARDAAGGFVGWSRLFEAVPGEPEADPMGLLLHLVEVHDGEFIYQAAGAEPIAIPGIQAQLTMPPAAEPGWRGFTARIDRPPLLSVQASGRMNVADSLLMLEQARAQATVTEAVYADLPPGLQQRLRDSQVRGRLLASLQGSIPLREWQGMAGRLSLEAHDAQLAVGDAPWPIRHLRLESTMAGGDANVRYDAQLLGGTAGGSARLGLGGAQPLEIAWQAEGLRIEQVSPQHAGHVRSQGRLSANLSAWPMSMAGGGTLSVEEGRLVNLPVIREIAALAVRAGIAAEQRTDSARVDFQFRPDHVQLTRLEVDSQMVGLRGSGQVFYDRRLDLTVQADVLERLQETIRGGLGELGPVGDILGIVGPRAATYQVHGTVSEPKVTLRPLGRRR